MALVACHAHGAVGAPVDSGHSSVTVKDFQALAAATASKSPRELVVVGDVRVDEDLTIPKNITLHFLNGGKVAVAAGRTLTVDCHVDADVRQHIFDGPGKVVMGWNADQKVSICWMGADSGNSDNSRFIQWALDGMSSIQGTVIVPSGDYRYTSPLRMYSNTTLEGQGRKFISTLHPVNCAALIVDGAKVTGGWIFRSKIRDLTIYGDDTTDAYNDRLISLTNVYNLEMENVWIYNQKPTFGLFIKNCADIVLSGLIVYGVDNGGRRKGIYCENSSVKMIAPDVENLYTGIHCTGGGSVDIVTPYMERCIVGYRHEATTGTTRIFGGMISSINGYCVHVLGDHLYVYGTDLEPYRGPNPGGPGIITEGGAFPHVYFHDIPKTAKPGFFDRTTNWLSLHLAGTMPVAGYDKGTVDFSKEATNHAAVDVIEFDDVDYANCELRVYAPLGKTRYISKAYTFAVNEGSFSPVLERTEVNSGNDFKLNVYVKQISAGRCKVVVKADNDGSLLRGKIPLNFQLTYQAKISAKSRLFLR
jgi:hypothetical protein